MIFLDTGFLFAFVSDQDANHARVVAVLDEYRGRQLSEVLVTTNHVVAETITLVRARGHRDPGVRHDMAVAVGRQLFAGTFGRIHQASAAEEREAFLFFSQHQDQDYSMVDCLSFVVMGRLGIAEALSVDRDFTHRFVVRPGPA